MGGPHGGGHRERRDRDVTIEALERFKVELIEVRGDEKVPMSTRAGEFVTLRQLRSEVGKNLNTRLTPTLEFILDAIPENADHISALLREARERVEVVHLHRVLEPRRLVLLQRPRDLLTGRHARPKLTEQGVLQAAQLVERHADQGGLDAFVCRHHVL